MDQDIDFDREPTKSARKKPSSSRRRREMESVDDDNLDAVLESALISNSTNLSSSKPQPQPRKSNRAKDDSRERSKRDEIKAVSGWAADDDLDLESGQSVQRSHRREPGTGANFDFGSSEQNHNSSTSNRQYNRRELNEQEEIEIPEIPDLEEQEEPVEDMAFKVAEAPDVQVHQISTYKELDKEFFKEKAFQFLEGNVDVSLLHCGLNTEQQIAEEEDVIWEWNKLFTEVVSVLSVTKDSDMNEPDPFGDYEELNKLNTASVSNNQGKRERDINF